MTQLAESRSMIRPNREVTASAYRFVSRVSLYTAFLVITFLVFTSFPTLYRRSFSALRKF